MSNRQFGCAAFPNRNLPVHYLDLFSNTVCQKDPNVIKNTQTELYNETLKGLYLGEFFDQHGSKIITKYLFLNTKTNMKALY